MAVPEGLGPWGERLWQALRRQWQTFEDTVSETGGACSLAVTPGRVTGGFAPEGPGRPRVEAVMGSDPAPVGAWASVYEAYPLDLGSDDLSPNVVGHLRRFGVELFPRDVRFECSLCGRPRRPCRHLAALITAVTRRVDRDPQLLLRFRGWVPGTARPAGGSQGHNLAEAETDVLGEPRRTPSPGNPPTPTLLPKPQSLLPEEFLHLLDPELAKAAENPPLGALRELITGIVRRPSAARPTQRMSLADFWLGGVNKLGAAKPDPAPPRVDLPLHLQPPPSVAKKLDMAPLMRLVCAALREWGEQADGESWPTLGFGPEELREPGAGRNRTQG